MPTLEFTQRLNDFLDGVLDESERAALEREVASDPEAKSAFDEAVWFETLLSAAHSPAAAGDRIMRGIEARLGQDKIVRGTRFRWWPAAAAAAVLIAALVALQWGPRPQPIAAHRVLAGELRANGILVQVVPEGAVLEVAGESPAVLWLSDGSRLEFAPGTKARIQGARGDLRQVVELTIGTGLFHVEHGGGRFQVTTPLGKITVLGTEFSVALRPESETEATQTNDNKATKQTMKTRAMLALAVAVTFGHVEVEIGGKTYTLSAGQTAYAKEGERQAVRETGGEVTKADAQSITVTIRKEGSSLDQVLTLSAATVVMVETPENEAATGKEGKLRPKLSPGTLGDLKVGQRVKVQYDAGAALRIVVQRALPAARPKEGERQEAPKLESKSRKGGEGERGREQPAPKPAKERKEGER